MAGSLQILVSSFFVFGDLSCVIFFTMVSICKARKARLLKNVNKHFRNFISQNKKKTKMRWKAQKSRQNALMFPKFIVASGTSCQKTSVCIQWADATKTTQFSLRKPMQSGDLAGSGPADRPTSPWPDRPTCPGRPPSGPACCTGYSRTYLCQYLCCLKVSWP